MLETVRPGHPALLTVSLGGVGLRPTTAVEPLSPPIRLTKQQRRRRSQQPPRMQRRYLHMHPVRDLPHPLLLNAEVRPAAAIAGNRLPPCKVSLHLQQPQQQRRPQEQPEENLLVTRGSAVMAQPLRPPGYQVASRPPAAGMPARAAAPQWSSLHLPVEPPRPDAAVETAQRFEPPVPQLLQSMQDAGLRDL